VRFEVSYGDGEASRDIQASDAIVVTWQDTNVSMDHAASILILNMEAA
jgi:hypothetical protein